MLNLKDTVLHRWLRVPYSLNVHYQQRPKKPRATVVLLHGIGNSGASWDKVVALLPDDVRVITVDLLGFGRSKKPSWAVYDAATQTRSFLATYFKLGIRGPMILAGHSMGALVAVEVTKRYPRLVRSLILCSPPFYRLEEPQKNRPSVDKALKGIFKMIEKHPEEFVKISSLAARYRLIDKRFKLTDQNIDSYLAALRASIINQQSLSDAKRLSVPITIIHGLLDPVVIPMRLRELAKANSRVQVKNIMAGHQVNGLFVTATAKAIKQELAVHGRDRG